MSGTLPGKTNGVEPELNNIFLSATGVEPKLNYIFLSATGLELKLNYCLYLPIAIGTEQPREDELLSR
jgi:hypothetical protein